MGKMIQGVYEVLKVPLSRHSCVSKFFPDVFGALSPSPSLRRFGRFRAVLVWQPCPSLVLLGETSQPCQHCSIVERGREGARERSREGEHFLRTVYQQRMQRWVRTRTFDYPIGTPGYGS